MGKTMWARSSSGLFADSSGFGSIGTIRGNGTDLHANENVVRAKLFHDGTFSNFRIHATSIGGDSITTFRKNAADSALSIFVAVGTPEGWQPSDLDSVSVSNGDYVDVKYTGNRHPWTLVDFEAASDHVQYFTAAEDSWLTASGAGTFYQALVGPCSTSVVTSNAGLGVQFQVAGTLGSGRFFVGVNSQTQGMTVQLVKNGVAGDPSVTVPAGTTGEFLMSGSVAIVAGDQCYWKFVTTGTGSVTGNVIQCAFVNTNDNTNDLFCAHHTAQGHQAVGASSSFIPIMTTSEGMNSSQARLKLGYNATISKLRLEVISNTCTQDQTLKVYQNGVATPTLACVITAGGTGIFIDSTHADHVLADDFLAISWTGGGTGQFTAKWMGLTIGETEPAQRTYGQIFGL